MASSAKQARLKSLDIFFQVPIYLSANSDLEMDGWTPTSYSDGISFDQRNYFHTFVGNALFGDKSGSGPVFETFIKDCPNLNILADRVEVSGKGNERKFSTLRFELKLKKLEFRKTSLPNSVGIFSVLVSLTGASRSRKHEDMAAALDDTHFTIEPLNLEIAQSALEYLRRLYPRWWRDEVDIPGDTVSQVIVTKSGETIFKNAIKKSEYAEQLEPKFFPWIEELIAPVVLSGPKSNAEHFNDDRPFMFSSIVLDKDRSGYGSLEDAEAFSALVGDGDLFRLAEADPPGHTPLPYAMSFLDTIRERTFYDRHAPGEGAPNWRSTRYVFSQHHACGISVSDPKDFNLARHIDHYYRHMQFLCIFEYLTLLRFSQRLSRTVRKLKGNDKAFAAELAALREEFLEFTHLHHFSNVSTQLQGREIFEKIYNSIGVDAMFGEVEAEIRSASEYAAGKIMLRQADNAERLARLASIGIPASIAVGAAGMNLMIGSSAPVFFEPVQNIFLQDVRHFLFFTTIIFSVWVFIRKLSFPKQKQEQSQNGIPKLKQWAEPDTLIAVVSFILFIITLLLTVGDSGFEKTDETSTESSLKYSINHAFNSS